MQEWFPYNDLISKLILVCVVLAISDFIMIVCQKGCLPRLGKVRRWVYHLPSSHPVLLSFIIFIIVFIPVLTIALLINPDGLLEGVVIEAFGMVFDLLVIGYFVFWLQRVGDRQKEIKRYQEELEDLRNWRSEESCYLSVRNIKRLNALGVSRLHLEGHYLVKAELSRFDLADADLIGADLTDAMLIGTNLVRANLGCTNLTRAFLTEANLSGATLIKTNLSGACLADVNLSGAVLRGTNLSGASLKDSIYDSKTIWPDGFDYKNCGAIKVN
jgi:BTB/POZ domain-containing protein KCTD9